MSKELIMENDWAILWYYPEFKIGHHKMKKYLFGDNFQELLLKAVELLKSKRANKWLSDDRNHNASRVEDAEWANKVWLPNMINNGFKYWAIILPEKAIGQMNIKRYAQSVAEKGVIVKIFGDPDEGLKWLKEQ